MVQSAEGYVLPNDSDRMPLTFSLTATMLRDFHPEAAVPQ